MKSEVLEELERLERDTRFLKGYPGNDETINIAIKYMTKYSLLLNAIKTLELEKTYIVGKK